MTEMKDVIVKQSQPGLKVARASLSAIGLNALIALALSGAASAQAPDAAKPAAKPAASKAATAAAPAAGGGNDSGLKARVETLEEQLVDMQVVVGTLESLAKPGGSSSAPAFKSGVSSGADASRVEALENQVRSLSSQVQQLSDQLRGQGGAARRSDVLPPAGATQNAAASPSSFGSTTVTPGTASGGGDAIGGLISGTAGASTGASTGALGATPAPVQSAALAASWRRWHQ